jgi:hypothetical protein
MLLHHRRHLAVVACAVLAAAALAISCYPGDELNVADTDVVITLFDPNADFSTKLTYAMPDTVVHIVGEDQEDDITRAYDSMVLNGVASNLEDLGFTRVDDPETADVLVVTAALAVDYSGYVSYGWYWGYWYGYPPGYGGWYPYYPSGGYSYSYTMGTVFILMMDPDNGGEERTPPIWSAALNGIADTYTNSQRITAGIDQAFAQSQYLAAGK